jgi:hypothetical protein
MKGLVIYDCLRNAEALANGPHPPLMLQAARLAGLLKGSAIGLGLERARLDAAAREALHASLEGAPWM